TEVIFDAVTEARKIKPSIPTIGKNGIEIRDEIVLKKCL
ncbi:GNAT family N-acetyltransferase, partial [Staphylococcus aureus]|nr:GNAT family N-acetyltransferase [Staphylococcus aureus]